MSGFVCWQAAARIYGEAARGPTPDDVDGKVSRDFARMLHQRQAAGNRIDKLLSVSVPDGDDLLCSIYFTMAPGIPAEIAEIEWFLRENWRFAGRPDYAAANANALDYLLARYREGLKP